MILVEQYLRERKQEEESLTRVPFSIEFYFTITGNSLLGKKLWFQYGTAL